MCYIYFKGDAMKMIIKEFKLDNLPIFSYQQTLIPICLLFL